MISDQEGAAGNRGHASGAEMIGLQRCGENVRWVATRCWRRISIVACGCKTMVAHVPLLPAIRPENNCAP